MNTSKIFLISLLPILFGSPIAYGQANTSLSNLTATAINQSLLVDTDSVYSLGSSSKELLGVYASSVVGNSGLTISTPNVTSGPAQRITIQTGDSSAVSGSGGPLFVQSGNDFAAGGSGGSLWISAGSGTTSGGNVTIAPGFGSGGVNEGTLTISGHLTSSDFAPTVSACGTSASVTGTDTVGRINIGTGGVSSCTITFFQAWPSYVPVCFINNETARVLMKAVPSSTTLVISAAANFAASTILDYFCMSL